MNKSVGKVVKTSLSICVTVGVAAVSSQGCLTRPLARAEPDTSSTLVGRLEQNGVDKIDLLLAIDNSGSMADKQDILAKAVPVLVRRLVEPRCVDLESGEPTGVNVDAAGACADGSKPEFASIRDINVGVISSSLGDLTTGVCKGTVDHDDGGKFVSRPLAAADTFQGQGFLAWDPDQTRGGESNAEDLEDKLAMIVDGVGESGCGYEMQLESIVRFLVDPEPYASLEREGTGAAQRLVEVGVDEELLAQRAAFLRPDSLLAVIVLSDENDCSFDVTKQGFKALPNTSNGFYRATSECADDVNDACCMSCGLPVPAECDAGGACAEPKYTALEDHVDLKCFKQKERYGVDFLYPVERYVNAFTQARIDPTRADLAVVDEDRAVDNPLFVGTPGARPRSADLVFVAGIVGVPWQAIARRNEAGEPDLREGYRSFSELEADLPALVGDPDRYVEPTDPFMIESTAKRSGTSGITGATLPGANPINGGDYYVDPSAPDDLQHACIFPIAETAGTDCSTCTGPTCDNPLCNGTQQIAAKAYPSLRELSLLAGMRDQGIFSSICPGNADGEVTEPDFGYNPAVDAIIDRLKKKLQGECFGRQLRVDPATGNASCLVIEARTAEPGETCCDPSTGRISIPETKDGGVNPKYLAVEKAQDDDYADPNWNCFCEIVQLSAGEEREACLEDIDPQGDGQGNGWCYIDAAVVPPVGNPALVAECPADEKRLMRFVGEAQPLNGASVYVTCAGE